MRYHDILLIDDDEDDREIFISALNSMNISVNSTALGSAIEALDKLSSKTVTADVIFLDLNMPLMNGQEFLVEIKKLADLRYIPVIIFSTSRNPLSVMKAKECGAHDYITKPYTINELTKVLEKVLAV